MKVNLLIIGNGHYATGMTTLSDIRKTDKDYGVLLPAALALQKEGLVGNIGIAARNGQKLLDLKNRLLQWENEFGWQSDLTFYPDTARVDENAYLEALATMPKPCVALIAVPDFLHKEIMLACINRDVAFLVVKPAVTRLDDLYAVIDRMNAQSVFGMVDYHKVFDEANILLKSEYEAGLYGSINHVYSLMTQRRDMLDIYQRWFDMDRGLNINHYLGSHYIHLTGYITDAVPLDVRATSQGRKTADTLHPDVADVIETQVRWRDNNGHVFTSYHVSGWNDPHETESMTYQEIHMLTEKGHVDSDQRYRGFRKVISGKGYEAVNPYFFNLTRNPLGELNLNTKYGYLSVKTFVQAAMAVLQRELSLDELDKKLPTIRESAKVTAILEAADLSLKNNSRVIAVNSEGGRFSVI